MASRAKRLCNYPGCNNLVEKGYCDKHTKKALAEYEKRRGTAAARGYTYRWQLYSKAYLRNPNNQFCTLQLDGCTNIAECVDHVDPPSGSSDPKFWDRNNHQAACIHCNSVKGHRLKHGRGKPFEADMRGRGV